MSTSLTIKSNPFQRSNPFQVQTPYQPSIGTSFNGYQAKASYRPVYESQSFVQKQNSFSKKPQGEMWKFRDDNCGKVKGFSHGSNAILHEKYLQEKNSFEKELVLSSVARRQTGQHVNNNSGQQVGIERAPIQNPFGRKYLISGNTLVESQVYVGFKGHDKNPTYDQYKTEYETCTPNPQPTNIYSYSNYSPPVPVQDNYMSQPLAQIGFNPQLQTSLHHKNSQYGSRKSLQREDRNSGSYKNMNAVESRYSLERENKYNAMGSNKDLYEAYGRDTYGKENAPVSYSKSNIPYAEKDRLSRVYSRVSVKEENVKFQQSDDEDSRNQSRQKNRQPTFGSKKNIPALPGPQLITVKGVAFYRQQVVSC